MKTHVEFTNGHKMPIVGLGMWQATNPEELEIAVDEALKAGYRHFDTATMYDNEEVLGRVLKKWLDADKLQRTDLFVVTKLPRVGMRPEHVGHFLNLSLKKLQLDYVDLYLIHCQIGMPYVSDTEMWPKGPDGRFLCDMTTSLESVWKSMEEQVDKGLAKSIGVSNFTIPQLQRIINVARIHPENIQVELNASFQQKDLQEFCKKNRVTICAYAPIGSPGRKSFFEARGLKFEIPPLMDDPVVVKIAQKYGKTPAQILLHFLALKDIVVIPKSTNPDRLKANFEILDLKLKDEDLEALEGLDKGDAGRTFNYNALHGLEGHPEFPKW